MLFANIFKLKESKMLLFGKEISSKYSQCRIYYKIFHVSKFKEFPNDENVTKQKPFQRVEMENIRRKIPSDHLLN